MPLSTKFLVRLTAKLTRCLSLALLPALASEAHALSAPQRKPAVRSTAQQIGISHAKPRPYLAALGALPLRFARPGAEPTAEPPLSPEPKPETPPEQLHPSANDPLHPHPSPSSDSAPETHAPLTEPAAAPLETPAPAASPALPILPDDTRRELRPEDVLPFFRYPHASPTGDARVEVLVPFTSAQPQSIPPPPSSATYHEK